MNRKFFMMAAILIPTLATAGENAFSIPTSIGDCNEKLPADQLLLYKQNKFAPHHLHLERIKVGNSYSINAVMERNSVDIEYPTYPPKVQHLSGQRVFEKQFDLVSHGEYRSSDGASLSIFKPKRDPLLGGALKGDVIELPETPYFKPKTDYELTVNFQELGGIVSVRMECRLDQKELAKIDPLEGAGVNIADFKTDPDAPNKNWAPSDNSGQPFYENQGQKKSNLD